MSHWSMNPAVLFVRLDNRSNPLLVWNGRLRPSPSFPTKTASTPQWTLAIAWSQRVRCRRRWARHRWRWLWLHLTVVILLRKHAEYKTRRKAWLIVVTQSPVILVLNIVVRRSAVVKSLATNSWQIGGDFCCPRNKRMEWWGWVINDMKSVCVPFVTEESDLYNKTRVLCLTIWIRMERHMERTSQFE